MRPRDRVYALSGNAKQFSYLGGADEVVHATTLLLTYDNIGSYVVYRQQTAPAVR